MSHDQHIQAREAASKIKMSNNAKERTRVYVGDLGSGGSKPELEREFEHFGPLRSVWVARNPPGEIVFIILHLRIKVRSSC